MIRNGVLKKYGSFDGVPQDGNQPLENMTDQVILEKIIQSKTFAVIPVMNDEKYMRSIYTIGCWYYWRTPEIVLRFSENINIEPEIIQQIIGSIHSHLYEIYKDDKDDNDRSITPSFKKNMEMTIDKYELTMTLNLIEPDNYLDLHSPYMLWFYAFWDQNKLNNQNEITDIYPVYLIELDTIQITRATTGIIGNMIDMFINRSIDCKDNILSDDLPDLNSDDD